MQERRQQCPICAADVMPMSRYPDYVCESCVGRATNLRGESVSFANVDISGGLIGYVWDLKSNVYVEDAALTKHPKLLINGIRCYAAEAHFGGVVIRTERL